MDFMSRHLAYQAEQREIAIDGYYLLGGAIVGLLIGFLLLGLS